MKVFRGKYGCIIFAFLAGVAFLNMSFILAEIDSLGLTKQSTLIQNLINSGAEEEKESSSKTNPDDIREFYLPGEGNEIRPDIFYLIAAQANSDQDTDKPLAAYLIRFCPPPEGLSMLS